MVLKAQDLSLHGLGLLLYSREGGHQLVIGSSILVSFRQLKRNK